MKKVNILLAAALTASLLAGCQSEQAAYGSAAPGVSAGRTEYLASVSLKKTKDISSVIAFMDTLQKMTGDSSLKNYSTSYDPETETVYVTTNKANIAFHLDETGNVMFASSNGDPATKTALSQAITKVYMGAGITNAVDSLVQKAKETQWLNSINAGVIQASVLSLPETELSNALQTVQLQLPEMQPMTGNTQHTQQTTTAQPDAVQLITDAFTLRLPNLNSIKQTDLERALSDGLEMPKLTDSLENYGVKDLSNYYEAPSLEKFWTGVDMSGIKKEVDSLTESGISLKASFDGLKLDNPELDVPTWNLKSYTLPSSFSDGTSTNLGKETLNAFNGFQGALNELNDALIQKELQDRSDAAAAIQDSNSKGNQSVSDKISENKQTVSQIEQNNNQTVIDKNNAASAQQGSSGSGSIWGAYQSGKQQTQNNIDAAKQENNNSMAGIVKEGQGISDSIAAQEKNINKNQSNLQEAQDRLEDKKDNTALGTAKDSVTDVLINDPAEKIQQRAEEFGIDTSKIKKDTEQGLNKSKTTKQQGTTSGHSNIFGTK